MGLNLRAKILAGAGVLLLFALSARAAQRITLRNGFAIRCDHSARIQGRVRLYLSAGGDNYIELAPSDIASVEQVSDPPANPPAVKPAAQSAPQSPRPAANLNPGDISEILAAAGRDHNLDVDLLASVVKAESGGNPRAVSPVGARGLMQLMPQTAASLGVRNSFQPQQNVQGGSAYLDALLTRYHNNLALALAAYNAGPEAVARYNGIPPYPETRAYVARVIHEFNRRVLAREAHARRVRVSSTTPQP